MWPREIPQLYSRYVMSCEVYKVNVFTLLIVMLVSSQPNNGLILYWTGLKCCLKIQKNQKIICNIYSIHWGRMSENTCAGRNGSDQLDFKTQYTQMNKLKKDETQHVCDALSSEIVQLPKHKGFIFSGWAVTQVLNERLMYAAFQSMQSIPLGKITMEHKLEAASSVCMGYLKMLKHK